MIENLPNEVWKTITDFPNYQVSNMGRVKSLNKYHGSNERILKPIKNKYGYLQVHLKHNNSTLIHRLVANAFIPNDNLFKTEINHKSEDKTDNRVENLEWCDRQYNVEYSQARQVNQYSLDGKTLIKAFPSTKEIERQLGFANNNISACCNGKIKTAYGFIWKYA